MVYVIIGFFIFILGLLGIFVPIYFQAKNLKREEIFEILKEEYIKFSPYQAEQEKRRKEISEIKERELVAGVENELESYRHRREEGGKDLTKFELKHERRLTELLSRYKNV
ncbi:hypothetical protein AMJ44_06310 [candidate division WOR-1 bacterium DG_54_3]|uniref:Uncharacterized protein n=1 Tax=candidate division WOR-1 bacterium DG_54_3 TaxID=1703775 RepID=A0A0S7Y1C4_UNCSA|nr:MAG: hypothetical protein AMJ44_06310 [candidate division WOR-1 bacterium DG_54_3]